jgi:hypothetical protein
VLRTWMYRVFDRGWAGVSGTERRESYLGRVCLTDGLVSVEQIVCLTGGLVSVEQSVCLTGGRVSVEHSEESRTWGCAFL